MREYKVFKIENGTVIDHIPSPLGIKVLEILGHDNDGIVSVGMNFSSKQLKAKDLIKFENKFLDKAETDRISLIAPTATINIIRNGKVVEKRPIAAPSVIDNHIICPNPQCVTNIEHTPTKFYLEKESPILVRCAYCERTTTIKPDMLK